MTIRAHPIFNNVMQIILALCLIAVVFDQCNAEDVGYWSIELPVPKSGSNIERKTNSDVFTKKVSFDWRGSDTSELRKFYIEFFNSLGWTSVHPMVSPSAVSDSRADGWASSVVRTRRGKPYANYSMTFQASSNFAFGWVTLKLYGIEDGELSGTVDVEIQPNVEDFEIMHLGQLLLRDPRNIFRVEEAVHGNPMVWFTVALPANYEDESDPLLREYYRTVEDIRLAYKGWWIENVGDPE